MEVLPILWDIRSTHNVGAILRIAACFGIPMAWCVGITPYPRQDNDQRLPHISERAHREIAKTALGAETMVTTTHFPADLSLISTLQADGYTVAALEQWPTSQSLDSFKHSQPDRLAIIFGNEPQGLPKEVVAACDMCIEIPQAGQKESLNVSVAAGIALYTLTVINS